MNNRGLLRHTERRVLEDAAFTQGVMPTRIWAFFLPIWCADIKATTIEASDYALIDCFVERSLAEGGLTSAEEIVELLGLDSVVVRRALGYLRGIGHVAGDIDGPLRLTEWGYRSVQDGKLYVRRPEDRRKLYFDGYTCHPLTKPYYDPTVEILRHEDLYPYTTEGFPRYWTLPGKGGFRREALDDLLTREDRRRFNVPVQLHDVDVVEVDVRYLPLYLVRGLTADGSVRFLAYTQPGSGHEPDRSMSQLFQRTDELSRLVEGFEDDRRRKFDVDAALQWLTQQRGYKVDDLEIIDGRLRAVMPAEAFDGGEGAASPSMVGSFLIKGSDVVHLWCADDNMRERALLERASNYLSARAKPDPDETRAWIGQVTRQLGLDLTMADLRELAGERERRDLADLLEGLLQSDPS